jgi:hypothetical protein
MEDEIEGDGPVNVVNALCESQKKDVKVLTVTDIHFHFGFRVTHLQESSSSGM